VFKNYVWFLKEFFTLIYFDTKSLTKFGFLSLSIYRGADMSLAQPGSKQATVIEDFDVHISYLKS
jgi:hypothetical protein